MTNRRTTPNPSYRGICLVALFPGDDQERGYCRSCAADETRREEESDGAGNASQDQAQRIKG